MKTILDDPVRICKVHKLIFRKSEDEVAKFSKAGIDFNLTVEQLTQHDITNKVSKFRFD